MGDFFNQENLCTKVVEKKTAEAGNWNHSLLEKICVKPSSFVCLFDFVCSLMKEKL